MIRFMVSIIIIILFTLPSCTKEEERNHLTVEEDINTITMLFDSVMVTARKGDLEAYLALYTDDALWMLHDRLKDAGKEEVRRYYSWVNDYTFDQVLTLDEINIAGDWAFVRFTVNGWILPKPGIEGERERVVSRHFTIVSKQDDGSWKLARDMFINPRIKELGETGE